MGEDEVSATRGWVTAEVKKQMEPLIKGMEEIKRQNAEQTRLLSEHATGDQLRIEGIAEQTTGLTKLLGDHAKVVDQFDHWRRALWGNGTGPPGFLEVARAEDKQKYSDLLKAVTGLQADRYREQGKTDLRKEQAEDHLKAEGLSDTKKTNKLQRAHIWLAIATVFAGTWILDLIKPLLVHMLANLTK
jgi:hypothetical protein